MDPGACSFPVRPRTRSGWKLGVTVYTSKGKYLLLILKYINLTVYPNLTFYHTKDEYHIAHNIDQ